MLTLLGINFDVFTNQLKIDYAMINPTLPEWDSECNTIARELFDILDKNQDRILDKMDLYSDQFMTLRTSKIIANKVKGSIFKSNY